MPTDPSDPSTPAAGERDRGMTLPELLLAVTVLAVIMTVLASAIVVTLRQADSTEGRVNVARAEQSINTWLPADLASTDVTNTALPAVDTDPAASPCGNCGTIDLSGANALQLAWTTKTAGTPPIDVVTRVQYQYIEVDGEWQIQRIECIGAEPCRMNVVLHDLKPPADVATFDPDTDSPIWVMDVAIPADPADLDLSDNARQVVVTIDGGGGGQDAGGGLNTISLTAGGAVTDEIEPDDFTPPEFVRARSRCGGPVTLIVDDSGSIGGAVSTVVEPGVEAFIEAFRGTPTQLQIVSFSYYADTIGAGSDWHKYVDMTDDAAVDALKAAVVSELDSSGGTNWEDAFFRAFKNSDGSPATTMPNRVVFFTDGIPTLNRITPYSTGKGDPSPSGFYRTGDLVHYNAGPYDQSVGWTEADRQNFNQEAFDRADVILDGHRTADLIFVGVGPNLANDNNWIYNPAVYADASAPPASPVAKSGADIIAFLLANGGVPVTAIYDPVAQEYTNPLTADYYLQSSFDQIAFGAAMKAAALKDCGGTLTVQTKYLGGPNDGQNVTDEFVYENAEYRDDAGNPVDAEPRRVTTSDLFRTGTFDFEISSGTDFFSVDVVPQELQTLSGFTPQGWSCRAGADTKTITPIPIDASAWEGFTVDIRANEAVSCVLEVSQP